MSELKVYYKFDCRTGCGVITITDSIDGSRVVKCSNCGHEDTLEFQGEVYVAKGTTLAGLPSRLEEDDNQ